MDFQRHQSASANSLFPTYEQASLNIGSGNAGNVAFPFYSIPSGSLQDTETYMPWSHNALDDPYGLSCIQSSTKNRKLEYTDCNEETDLQGLVSNILDETDPQDSYYSIGSLPTCNSIWAPKTLKEELLQYSQSKTKVQHNTTFTSNYVSHDNSSKAQGQTSVKDERVKEFCLPCRDPTTSQQWLCNLPNGDRDSSNTHPPNLPPGLSVPSIGNPYLSQIHQSKNDNIQPLNDFPGLTDVFKAYSEMNSPCFDTYYKGGYTQGSTKAISIEQCVPKNINQLVKGFQSLMAAEHDSFSNGEFPNIHKQMLDMHHERSNSPLVSTQTTPPQQIQKQVGGEFGIVQRNGGVRKQNLLHEEFQDPPGINRQNTDYYQQPKSFSPFFNHPKQYQNNISMQRENINMSRSQHFKHDLKHSQIQKKMKPQLQKDNKVMHVSGFLEDGTSARPLTNTHTREREIKKSLVQNQYFDLQGSIQSQRFESENSFANLWNTQQLMPLVHPNDPRRQSSIPNVCSRGTLPYGCSVLGVDVGDMVLANESAAFSSFAGDMMTSRGESSSNAPATTSMVTNGRGLETELNSLKDECYEQWRSLQKERKRIEVTLTKTFPGKWPAAVNNTPYPDTPPNPTEVDILLVKQIGEKAKVASLLERMESLCKVPFHKNIHTALKSHHTAICITQARCNGEKANMSKQQQQKTNLTEDRDTLMLVFALKDLTATTRKLRTALWCALQMTLPKPVKTHYHNYEDVTCSERCSSPFEGYSFRL